MESVMLYPSLSWEKNHPERITWTKNLLDLIRIKFDSFEKASDIDRFYSKYASLTKDQKIHVWGEIFCWVSYYESSWDPKEYEVDQGTQDDKGSWSTGLLQVSATDVQNYNLVELQKYTFEDLMEVIPNLTLGVALMARQLDKYKTIGLSSDIYWTTLSTKWFARYTQYDNIAEKIQNMKF